MSKAEGAPTFSAWAQARVPGARYPWSSFSDDLRHAWETLIGPRHERVREMFLSRRRQVDGWWVSEDHLAEGTPAYEWLAGIALSGLGALNSSEAV